MENILKAENLNKKFGHTEVLKDVSFTMESGVYGLLGPNGAGKTTLMRCITGLYRYRGEITLNDKKINNRKGNVVGYLPQKFGLFPELTVAEMLDYMGNMQGLPKKGRKEIIDRCLSQVNLADKKNVRIRKLSGGMVRRVGIAQALLSDPPIIIFDEPTAGLDPEERMHFKEIISNLSGEKIVLISTHIVEDVEACCDHIIVIDNGNILKAGPVEEIRSVAEHRVMEVEDTGQEDILYVERSFMKNGKKKYRVLFKYDTENYEEPTVEDGYLCLLKEK